MLCSLIIGFYYLQYCNDIMKSENRRNTFCVCVCVTVKRIWEYSTPLPPVVFRFVCMQLFKEYTRQKLVSCAPRNIHCGWEGCNWHPQQALCLPEYCCGASFTVDLYYFKAFHCVFSASEGTGTILKPDESKQQLCSANSICHKRLANQMFFSLSLKNLTHVLGKELVHKNMQNWIFCLLANDW